MSWSAPLTAVAGAQLTASQWNSSVRDNLLMTAPALATTAGSHFVATGANAIAERLIDEDYVATSQTTGNTSYTDLATVGPAVTLTTGTFALVGLSGRQSNATAGINAWTSFAVSSATTIAASDDRAMSYDTPATSSTAYHGIVVLQSGLTPGSNVFTSKYRSTSASLSTFAQRRIFVIPF